MRTFEQIKDEYATEKGYSEWYSLYKDHVFRIGEFENRMNEVAKRYAKEVAMEALKNASENVKLTISEFSKRKDNSIGWNEVTLKENLYIINDGCNIVANKKSILNESNIPEL